MKLFSKSPDGGKDSGVSAYFLIEWKRFFSVALLHFNPGTREAFHSHAFNAKTLWLKGRVEEERVIVVRNQLILRTTTRFKAGDWKTTLRNNMHRVNALTHTWALSFRGPWAETWQEWKGGRVITMTHGRRIVGTT